MKNTIKTNKAFRPLSAIALAVCMTVLSVPVFAIGSKDDIGTTGADFLNLPVGAKPVGMGGAYTAVAEGAEALYWNPAGLVQINDMAATVMATKYVEDVNYQYIAYAQRLTAYTVIAVSAFMSNIGNIDGYDINGTKTSSFTPKDQVYSLAVSQAILELSEYNLDVSMGFAGKYIRSKIVDSADAWAVDFGIMAFHYTTIPYRVGFVMQNLGKGLQFDQERDSLPLNFKVGGAVNILRDLVLAADVALPKGGAIYATVGGEYSFEPAENTAFFLRAGLNTQQLDIEGGLSGFTLGAGFAFHYFALDYAFSPMGDLGSTHRFALSFDFPAWKSVFKREERSIFGNENIF